MPAVCNCDTYFATLGQGSGQPTGLTGKVDLALCDLLRAQCLVSLRLGHTSQPLQQGLLGCPIRQHPLLAIDKYQQLACW